MKTVLFAFLAMPTVLSVFLGMLCYCEGKLEPVGNVPIDWSNKKNVDGHPADEVADDNTPSYADLEEKLKKVEEELVDVEEEVELMEGEGAGGTDEEKTLEQTKFEDFFDSEEPPDDRVDEDKPLEPIDSPWSDGEAQPTDIDKRSFHASEEEEEGGRRRELTKRTDENVGTSALRGVNEAEAISGGSVEQLNRRLDQHYPQHHFRLPKAGWCTPWGSGDELCSGAYGQQSETCIGVDAKFYFPPKTCDDRCIRARCIADALCVGYTKRKSDGAFKLKSKITGVHKSNGYDCYEKIKTERSSCYVMQIDCYHGDDSDDHSPTKDPIRFEWYDETGSLLYDNEVSSSSCNSIFDMDVVYSQKFARSIPVAYVNIIATGRDAFMIDEAKIAEIRKDKTLGRCLDWSSAFWKKTSYGQDNHGVYCISTDTTDKVNFASNKCHKAISFYVQDVGSRKKGEVYVAK